MPLNIDLQQILLHWMNLAILTGGLYFLLYKPVKGFMSKREEHYRSLDEEAAAKLAEAERIKAECQNKLEEADEEIRQERAKAQQSIQQSTEDQLAQAREQARQIVSHAQTEAEHSRGASCGSPSGSCGSWPPRPPKSWPSTPIPSTSS